MVWIQDALAVLGGTWIFNKYLHNVTSQTSVSVTGKLFLWKILVNISCTIVDASSGDDPLAVEAR